jgi:hypothetical protein
MYDQINWGGYRFTRPIPFHSLPPPPMSGVYAVSTDGPSWKPFPYEPLYFGETDNLYRRCGRSHELYNEWVRRAGSRSLFLSVLFAGEQDRLRIERELITKYNPPCNTAGTLRDLIRRMMENPSPSASWSFSDLLKNK